MNSPADQQELDTGTTVVGIAAGRDADASESATDDDPTVVIATDRRASLGHMVSSKAAQKVEPLADHAAMGFSGSVSGADHLARTLRAEISLFQTRRTTRMSPTAVASLVGNTLRETPVGVVPVVGAVGEAAHLFAYDGAGGMTEEPYAAVGSGMPYAYGHLESTWEPGLSVEAATDLAVEAVGVASERDTASGNGLNLAVVTAAGVDLESRESLPVGS